MYISSLNRLFFVVLAVLGITSAIPLSNRFQEAEQFLQQRGYLAKVAEEDQHYNDDVIVRAISKFQEDAELPATGFLTEETLRRMGKEDSNVRSIRSTSGLRWTSNGITWDIARYSKNLTNRAVDGAAEDAFKMWSDAANVSFTRRRGEVVDIEIAFLEGDHGDVGFGGRNKAIAHAFFPPAPGSMVTLDGDVHLDDAIEWTVKSDKGSSLLVNLVHELGHSIGILHSSNSNDIMHNPPPPYRPDLKLSENDKAAARQLYGAPEIQPAIVNNEPDADVHVVPIPPITPNVIVPPAPEEFIPPTSPRPVAPSSCIDAATQMVSEEIISIKGDDLWKIVNDEPVAGYPVKVSTVFPGLPSNIDSALTMPTDMNEWGEKSGKTYFFKDAQVWRYTSYSLDVNYPKTLAEEFDLDPLPDKVDAAFTTGGTRRIYFIAGTQYYIKTPYRQFGPYPISISNGFNTNATAALSGANDILYLFGADNRYYKVDPTDNWSILRDSAAPNLGWFNCN